MIERLAALTHISHHILPYLHHSPMLWCNLHRKVYFHIRNTLIFVSLLQLFFSCILSHYYERMSRLLSVIAILVRSGLMMLPDLI